MILIFKKNPENLKQKISALKEAIKDNLFLNDLEEISEDFKVVDLEEMDELNKNSYGTITV